ncbi:MAG: hypothetical protein JW715_14130 [Sedimentisphaerales bacterium]|nr:hypothetical protein [Sedimentisphaerales bacterium]
MKHENNIEETIQKKLNFSAGAELHDRILNDVMNSYEKSKNEKSAGSSPRIRRIIMKSPVTKLAAAAVIILAVILSISFWVKSSSIAYAFEQTIEANHTVRSLHIKDFTPGIDEPKEFWLEFDEKGQVKDIRMQMPEWESPSDGAKVIIWQEGKAKVWFKKKNSLLIVREQRLAERMLELARQVDPRPTMEHLYEQEQQGNVKIEIDEPSDKAKPITVTATYEPESSRPGRLVVLLIDQATKLLTAMEVFQLKNDEYQQVGRTEFHDYNQAIDPRVFSLEDEIPSDVMRIDQTTHEVGLAQGDLSDDEVAVEVVRQFFTALIAEDYTSAGQLFEGIPADKMRQIFGPIKILSIISIGPAGPHPIAETKGLVVPCTVEIEHDGETAEWELETIGVREVYNQPGRWTIFGGI